ncbi:MAG: hypothetical protein QW514_09200 [Thermoprotei archaeon]
MYNPFNTLIFNVEDGLVVILVGESYANRCSLDEEFMLHQDTYMGRRVKVGMFTTSKGI